MNMYNINFASNNNSSYVDDSCLTLELVELDEEHDAFGKCSMNTLFYHSFDHSLELEAFKNHPLNHVVTKTLLACY